MYRASTETQKIIGHSNNQSIINSECNYAVCAKAKGFQVPPQGHNILREAQRTGSTEGLFHLLLGHFGFW
jgi:hypothetical protein